MKCVVNRVTHSFNYYVVECQNSSHFEGVIKFLKFVMFHYPSTFTSLPVCYKLRKCCYLISSFLGYLYTNDHSIQNTLGRVRDGYKPFMRAKIPPKVGAQFRRICYIVQPQNFVDYASTFVTIHTSDTTFFCVFNKTFQSVVRKQRLASSNAKI